MYGELIPVKGGDPIPLLKKNLLVGRRESCDIVLRFGNVSAHHCQLTINGGYWYIRDQNSRNGIKVNGMRVTEKLLHPNDEICISKRRYNIQYVFMKKDEPVIYFLKHVPGWTTIYQDDVAVIVKRNDVPDSH